MDKNQQESRMKLRDRKNRKEGSLEEQLDEYKRGINEADPCSICQEVMDDNKPETLTEMRGCIHKYHKECIDKYMLEFGGKNCTLCKARILGPYVCPYDKNHDNKNANKLAYHMTKCKAKKGKEVYQCHYNAVHIKCSRMDL